jgi:hypothetical protein
VIRTYSELIRIPTFEERFEYLRFRSNVGEDTFGFDRYLNQKFYHSAEWKRIRRDIIIRDEGRDLAMPGYELDEHIIIHHMNPIKPDDLSNVPDEILNPEYLVCVSKRTHDAIHFGDKSLLPKLPAVRTPNDTCPWK